MSFDNAINQVLPSYSPVSRYINLEKKRQDSCIELIASENFCSDAVRAVMASCLTNKYAEGYPNLVRSGNKGRYYGGCQHVDQLEQYCCDMWKKVFKTDYHVNVQPHSGSQANQAAYAAVLKPGDTILTMRLDQGGHLTHGSAVNFSGKLYNVVFYELDANGFIDYEDVAAKAEQYQPKLILAGASAYPRQIDFSIFRDIANMHNCLFMVDMAHIAGLVAADEHPSPFGLADIITTTTHKTLRGPRGGLIFCKQELAKKIDSAVFPGSQGGPLLHVIAAKAICAEEALSSDYLYYIWDVVRNAKAMAQQFIDLGYDVITGGTDNHLFLIDFSKTHPNLSGLAVQETLDKVGITLNKNCVPNDERGPMETSGVRIGTAAMTTKGWNAKDFIRTAIIIHEEIEALNKRVG